MFRKPWWLWTLVLCFVLPLTGGCGNQQGDQKKPNKGLDKPKYVKDDGGT
jgi:hypothetical protein